MPKAGNGLKIVLLWLGFLIIPTRVFAAQLPSATQEMLKKLNLDARILANVDAELQVPAEWIEKAKKEGTVRMLSTSEPKQMKELFAFFNQRYPFIAVDYSTASHETRQIKTLTAFQGGRILTDVLTAVAGTFPKYKEANAVEDLRNLPVMKNVPDEAKDPGGLWVGTATNYWCISYNRKLVREQDLPKRWEDLIMNPRWRDRKIGLGNRPQLWVMNVWKAKGENWTKDFLTKLFTEVKPQLRKEGMSALVELVAAGEFDAAIPSSAQETWLHVSRGAPVGFACPEPVPASAEDAVILKGATNLNAARILLNWILSKEGQIARYFVGYDPPVHKDLRRAELLPFAGQILKKELSYRDPGLEMEVMPKLGEFWNGLWLRGGGRPR